MYTVIEMPKKPDQLDNEEAVTVAKVLIDELRVACLEASNVVKVLADTMSQRKIEAGKEYALYRKLIHLASGVRVNNEGVEIKDEKS